MLATLTAKGQITIPSKVRKLLKIKPGDKIDFVKLESGRVVIIPKAHTLKELKGCLRKPDFTVTIEQMNGTIKNAEDL